MTSDVDFISGIVAEAIKPAPRLSLSEWAGEHRIIPAEQSSNAGKWNNDLFPFLSEIMDCLCPWHPSETVTFCKSAQVGGTEIGINWLFAIVDMWPAPTMIVHQSLTEAKKWVRTKLSPSLRASTILKGKVSLQRSKDGDSTSDFKSFASGFWLITGANSSGGLSSQAARFLLKEEWDRWPIDVDGQGDPDSLADARQTSYHRSGKAKQFRQSTPTNELSSRVYPAFLEGDQRHFLVPCPHCDTKQKLEFFPDGQKHGGLVFNTSAPYEAKYACIECGTLIEHYHKDDMLAKGEWVAENEGPGVQPSFFINALYSPVTTWDKAAESFCKSKDDPQKLRTFYNLWLGLPWKEQGEAPDWQRLMLGRLDYTLGQIPLGGLILTTAADIQKDGIYFETVAWGEGKTSWSIDRGFIEGETIDPNGGAFLGLSDVYNRQYIDAFGNRRESDLIGVDTGYNTHVVYSWVRKRPKARALDGRAGWLRPAVGTPSRVEVNFLGKKIKKGISLWPVGTWPLKSELYGNLKKEFLDDGEEIKPGTCFFCKDHDEAFFKQLTAEYLHERKHNGRIVKDWKASGPNHYLDCRIYNMSLAEMCNISRMTDEEWDQLAAMRNVAPANQQKELFVPVQDSAEKSEPQENYINPKSDWLG